MTYLSFSPDGKKLFQSVENKVFVWGLENRKVIHTCPGSFFAISDDAHSFLTKVSSNTFQVWDSQTGNPLNLEEINPNTYSGYKRKEVLVDRENKAFIIRDVFGHLSPVSIDLGDKIASLDHWVLSPDGNFIAVAYYVVIGNHDGASGECIGLNGNTHFRFDVNRFTSVPLLYFAEHHPWLAVESRSEMISLYRLTNGKLISEFQFQQRGGRFFRIGPPPDPVAVIHNSRDSFAVKSNKLDKVITEPDTIVDVVFHPNGNQIASLLESQEIRLYDLKTLELINTLR